MMLYAPNIVPFFNEIILRHGRGLPSAHKISLFLPIIAAAHHFCTEFHAPSREIAFVPAVRLSLFLLILFLKTVSEQKGFPKAQGTLFN